MSPRPSSPASCTCSIGKAVSHTSEPTDARVTRLALRAPFRLDLTAALLGRFFTTATVPGWIGDAFICAVPAGGDTAIVALTQLDATNLEIAIAPAALGSRHVRERIRAMLGLDTDLTAFHRAAASLSPLREFDTRWRGVRPARTATGWEAGVDAIVYQSVSMLAAGAVIERLCTRLGSTTTYRGVGLRLFPTAQAVADSADADLRAAGMTGAKVQTIRALADAVLSGRWDDAQLESRPTAELCEWLTRLRGIGPWSAAVIALRGFGRLDVFPARDSGVARSSPALLGDRPEATADALTILGATRGMFYHYLLLARLEARGVLPLI